MVAYPRALLSIAASVCGLAFFLIFASLLLVSQSIGSTVRGYFYGVDSSTKFDSMNWSNERVNGSYNDGNKDLRKLDVAVPGFSEGSGHSQNDGNRIDDSSIKSDRLMSVDGQNDVTVDDNRDVIMKENHNSNSNLESETKEAKDQQTQEANGNSTSSTVLKGVENAKTPSLALLNSSNIKQPEMVASSVSPVSGNTSHRGSIDSGTTGYSLPLYDLF